MRIDLVVVYLITFLAFLDTHSLAPLMAPYARYLGAPVHLIGWIVAIYSVANLLGNLGSGLWTDWAGRKLPIVVGLVVAGTVLLVYPTLRAPHALLLARALHGLGSALVTPAALAYLGDAALSTSRGRAMAFYGVAYGVSGLIGPPLAGWLQDQGGYAAVFIGLSALMFGAALVAGGKIRSRPVSSPEYSDAPIAWRALLRPRLSVSFVAAFCWMFMMGTLLVFLPLIGEEQGFTKAQVGMLFGSFALVAGLVQISPLGRISDRWGRMPLIALGLALITIALLGLSVSPGWGAMMGAMGLYGLGFGFLFPAKSALLVDETTPESRGKASGVFMGMLSLGIIAGSGMAGAMERWHQAAGLHPFQTAALVVLTGLLWTGWVGLSPRRKPEASR